jgi:hypothetical protein
LASQFYNEESVCGCREDTLVTYPTCYTVDLGVIYNNTTDYTTGNTPCEECCYENQICTEDPHGKLGRLGRACAKLIVFTQARISGGQLYYNEILHMHSRQRIDLPRPKDTDPCQIINNIQCPAINGLSGIECSYECVSRRGRYLYGGPYIHTTATSVNPFEFFCPGSCFDIEYIPNESWKNQVRGYGFSPCYLSDFSIVGGSCPDVDSEDFGRGAFLAGYAPANGITETPFFYEDADTVWYLNTGKEPFKSVREFIIENNPIRDNFYHTIYLHYEMKTCLINCCKQNATRKWSSLTETGAREKNVVVQAALGFSCQFTGIDTSGACQKLYPNIKFNPDGTWENID